MAEATLTPLLTAMHMGLNQVHREPLGMVRTVLRDTGAERAAKGQTISVPVPPVQSLVDNAAASTVPNTAGGTTTERTFSIDKSKHYPIVLSGENTRALDNQAMYDSYLADEFSHAFRAILNEVEADLWAAAYVESTRATGTAGTAPFGSNLSDAANVRQILDDNGAPASGRALVVDTTAGANLRSRTQLTNVADAGTDATLRMGDLGQIMGFRLAESGQIGTHTKGTGANYLVDLVAGYAVGDTTIHVDTGTGTVLAGDVAVFEDDARKYIVGTGGTPGTGGGDIVLNEPGLRAALADGKTLTLGADYTPNLAFSRTAIALVARPPAMPRNPLNGEMGDAAIARDTFTDPVTGIVFDVAVYGGFHQGAIHVGLAWGVGVPNPRFIATLLG